VGALAYVLGAMTSNAQLYVPTGAVSPSQSGNVGIGVPNPLFTLDINGPGTRIMNGNGNSAQLDLVQTYGGHDWALVSWGATAGGGTLSNKFSIFDGTSGGHRFLIDSNGNIGIGTTSPTSFGAGAVLTEIHGTTSYGALLTSTNNVTAELFAAENGQVYVGSRSSHPLQLATGNIPRMTLSVSGDVGIGTTSPTSFGAGAVLTEIHGTTTYGALLTSTNHVTAELFASENGEVYVGSRSAHPVQFATGNIPQMTLSTSGNLGIGTTNPTQKLSVNGTIRAKEVVVETTGWSDYVFADNYVLQPLAEVEAQIKQEKHLPGIPSAQQVAESGIGLGEMQAKLLAKIEELTLHQIEQEKRIRALEAENARLRK